MGFFLLLLEIAILVLIWINVASIYKLLDQRLARLEKMIEENILKQDRTNQLLQMSGEKDGKQQS